MYDVVIIGKGPGGISTALYTVRANLSTLIVSKGFNLLYKADKIDNYYGFPEGISGKDLLENGVKQAKRLGVEFADDEIVGIGQDEYFQIIGKNNTYEAKAVVLAVGQPEKKISIKGIKEFEGKGISYCTTCDGFFYKNKKVGILGYNDYAIHEAEGLFTHTKNITLFTNGRDLEVYSKHIKMRDEYTVNTKRVSEIVGDAFIERIMFTDGTSEALDGLFIAYGSASAVEFATKMGVMTQNNAVVAEADGSTGIPGLFACGDCTGGFKQISVAVGEGAVAGKSVIQYLKSL